MDDSCACDTALGSEGTPFCHNFAHIAPFFFLHWKPPSTDDSAKIVLYYVSVNSAHGARLTSPTFTYNVETLVPPPGTFTAQRGPSSTSNSPGPCGPGISYRRRYAHTAKTKRHINLDTPHVSRLHALSHLIIYPAPDAKLDAFLSSI